MKVAVLQSNYIPWKGYFDLLDSVDKFVLYDIVQYTKNDWRNRNRVLVNGKPVWLTIPVRQVELGQLICDTSVADSRWSRKHWSTLSQSYSRSPFFGEAAQVLEPLYIELQKEANLSEINRRFIEAVCSYFGIATEILDAADFDLPQDRIERLLVLCEELGASTYVSGPAANSYLDETAFVERGIDVEWFSYGDYRAYKQLSEEFYPNVSVVDVMFNVGPEICYLRGER